MNMDLDTARQINNWLSHAALVVDGLGDVRAFDALADVSLADMMEARNIMDRENRKDVRTLGGRVITTVCDDRLIAAIYATIRFDASGPTAVERLTTRPDGASLCLVHLPDR